MTSGLDDFPRASHPTDQEYHVDLRCWMALASKLMVNIGKIIGKNHEKYSKMAELLYDSQLLDELHWSEHHGAYLGIIPNKMFLQQFFVTSIFSANLTTKLGHFMEKFSTVFDSWFIFGNKLLILKPNCFKILKPNFEENDNCD